jgi:AraC family transcriptional regulator
LDESKVAVNGCKSGERYHGLEIAVRELDGASAVRVLHPEGQAIEPHRHDLPFLMLPTLGGCRESFDGGEADVGGPAAVLHPPGSIHADRIHETGLETFTIEFDPAWVRRYGFHQRLERSRYFSGGAVIAAAGALRKVWSTPEEGETALGQALALFLGQAMGDTGQDPAPPWLDDAASVIGSEERPTTAALARRLDLHPAWLARAYRAAMGEGIGETLRRRRVERASRLLRRTGAGLAEVAVDAGFCDQSHMNRAFRQLLGRTPRQVREERVLLDALTD